MLKSADLSNANLHKWGLARSPSRLRPATDHEPHCRHVPINKIWRWTESIPRSRRWCIHMAGTYSDCGTREIIITGRDKYQDTETRWERQTLGPHRACLVTQQISVLQTVHIIQSQPSFLMMITWHVGHFIASPNFNSSWTHRQHTDTCLSQSVIISYRIRNL